MRSLQISRMIVLMILAVLAVGCDVHYKLRPEPPQPTQSSPVVDHSFSWDQQSLKRSDAGCPTAIFVAPNGDLEECE
jgi:hypothetical protein